MGGTGDTGDSEAPGPALPGRGQTRGGSREQREGQASEAGGRETGAGKRWEKAAGQGAPYRPR